MFCTKCGKQIIEGSKFCTGCGTRIEQQESQTRQQTTSQKNQQHYRMYEIFNRTIGIGKSFALTDRSLIYGSMEYAYSAFENIHLTNVPTCLSNGTAQALLKNGKTLLLVFQFNQKDRFIKTMNYANEQINLANGVSNGYKFLLQSNNGSKIEVYDDYLRMYYLPYGIKNVFNNAMRGGSIEQIFNFDEINVSISKHFDLHYFIFTVNRRDNSFSLSFQADLYEEAQRAILFISKQTSSENPKNNEPESITDVWQAPTGTQREFPLCGHTLQIPLELDLFNTYRLMFRKFADECANSARAEYNKKVRDLVTYIQFAPEIYGYYLEAMCTKAVQILISDGLWNITEADMLNIHKENYHLVLDDFSVTAESIELTIENNQRSVSNTMGFIPNLVGGGFGLKGAAIGIATATAFNIARDSVESSLINGAADINAAQSTELYNRIKPDILFEHFFVDYWRVFLTVVEILNKNNRNIWLPTISNNKSADGIFANLTNPNFPKDQLVSAFLDILLMKPYDKRYYQFMIDFFGDTEEVQAIRNYFGYTDFNNPRIT